MKQNQENKLSMYLVVQKVCADNNSVWNGVAACVTAMAELETKINAIVAARQVQENDTKGIAEDKSNRREKMIAKAMFVKGAVQAYATDTSNNELYKSVDYTVTEIRKVPDTIARDRALLIYNKANAIATNLTSYGISAAILTELQNSINDFAGIMASPRTAKSLTKAATLEISELFDEADLIVKRKLDKLMVQFKESNEAFYNTYLNAREIIDLGKGSKTIEVVLNASEVKTINRVINGSILKNTGRTTLIYCGDHLPPCDIGDENARKIEPEEEIEVKIKESFVTLRNYSTSEKGSFKVKVTSEVPVK
jgi:hypothetical protein